MAPGFTQERVRTAPDLPVVPQAGSPLLTLLEETPSLREPGRAAGPIPSRCVREQPHVPPRPP